MLKTKFYSINFKNNKQEQNNRKKKNKSKNNMMRKLELLNLSILIMQNPTRVY